MATLLNEGNSKTSKGEKLGYMTYGLHLAPYYLSGFNVCADASPGCSTACLNWAGRGAMASVQKARITKTLFFFKDKDGFLAQLSKEIKSRILSAKRKGMVPCFRLNLTSDLPWEKIKIDGKNLMEIFPEVTFYDYTKSPSRMTAFLEGKMPSNYHLTFSRSESNGAVSMAFLRSGGNVAMVFRNKLPTSYLGHKVVDGDETDLRFLDQPGVIVGLKEKGLAKKDETGFVLEP
jgi:hypothetical protein